MVFHCRLVLLTKFFKDPDEYLPSTTMDWCAQSLRAIGVNCPITYQQVMPENPEIPIHRISYLFLREAISHHISTNNLPQLSLSNKPRSAFNWVPPNAGNLELEADLEMGLLDPEYIAVEDLIECRGDTEQYHNHEQSFEIVG